MPLTEIAIDEIVRDGAVPCYASGRASFANGREYRFHAMFGHGYGDSRIFVYRHRDGGPEYPGGRVARAIHDRLGFTDIADRERDAVAAFETERVTACEALLTAPPAAPSIDRRPDAGSEPT